MKKKKENMMEKSKRIAEDLYHQYSIEEKSGEDCGKLLLDWIKENFWGIIVSKHIPTFEKVWKILNERGHTEKNKFVYGDIDVGLWVEYPKDKNKKVIISTTYCSMADDNTHLFILDKLLPNWIRFRVATVWPRENNKGGYMTKDGWFYWGDDRDVKTPSLNTYRKRDYKYGYYDCRDKGHCILYENHGQDIGRVEHAHYGEDEINHALWLLRSHLCALEKSSSGKA